MDWSFTIEGIFGQRYFAEAGLRSDGATASMIAFFSVAVRSRIGTLALADAVSVPEAAELPPAEAVALL